MDGLTVLQAIIGGLQVIGKIQETVESLRDASDSMKCLLTEISVMKGILEQLRPLIVSDHYRETEGAKFVELGDLVLVFTDLAKTLSNFDQFVSQVSQRTGLKGTTFFKSSLWVKNEKRFQRELMRLQYQKSSLNVILTLLTRLV